MLLAACCTAPSSPRPNHTPFFLCCSLLFDAQRAHMHQSHEASQVHACAVVKYPPVERNAPVVQWNVQVKHKAQDVTAGGKRTQPKGRAQPVQCKQDDWGQVAEYGEFGATLRSRCAFGSTQDETVISGCEMFHHTHMPGHGQPQVAGVYAAAAIVTLRRRLSAPFSYLCSNLTKP